MQGGNTISRVSPTGDVDPTPWITNLNGPRGIAIDVDNNLYVSNNVGHIACAHPFWRSMFITDVHHDYDHAWSMMNDDWWWRSRCWQYHCSYVFIDHVWMDVNHVDGCHVTGHHGTCVCGFVDWLFVFVSFIFMYVRVCVCVRFCGPVCWWMINEWLCLCVYVVKR